MRFIGAFSRLKRAKVLVIGDFMLDTYTRGQVARISPEAPVPVLSVTNRENLPGGAGNVVLNLKALGADVFPVGRVGEDPAGRLILSIFEKENITTKGLWVQKNWQTPIKNRFISDAQQLIRIDEENISPLPMKIEDQVLQTVLSFSEEIEAVAISDYAKGFLSTTLLHAILEWGNNLHIPILVDPKGDDFTRYAKATLITPNRIEAYRAAKLPLESSLSVVGKKLLTISAAKKIVITRSEEGMALFTQDGRVINFPAKTREVKDVTGAGDTALAVIAMTFASGIDWKEGIYLANLAAGLAVEKIGCARISLSDIAERLLEMNLVDKVFQERHLFVLEQVLQKKKLTMLALREKEGMSTFLFSQIKTLRESSEKECLLLYIIDAQKNSPLVTLLSSLSEVDFIIISSQHLTTFCKRFSFRRIFLLENGKVSPLKHLDELVV